MIEQWEENLPATVLEVTGPLTSEDLERTERLTKMKDDSWVLHEVITVWREQSNSERGLRRTYATAMLVALCVETVFASVMFVLLGTGVLAVGQWVANVFFAVVFGQIAAGVLAITRYLFPPGKGDALISYLLRVRHDTASTRRKSAARKTR